MTTLLSHWEHLGEACILGLVEEIKLLSGGHLAPAIHRRTNVRYVSSSQLRLAFSSSPHIWKYMQVFLQCHDYCLVLCMIVRLRMAMASYYLSIYMMPHILVSTA